MQTDLLHFSLISWQGVPPILLPAPATSLPVCTTTFTFLKASEIFLCYVFCFVSVAVNGHTSAPYRRVDRMIASYSLVFTFRLTLLFLQIFLILPNTAAAFPNKKSGCCTSQMAEEYTGDLMERQDN